MDLATNVKPKSTKHLKETEEIHGEHELTKKAFNCNTENTTYKNT